MTTCFFGVRTRAAELVVDDRDLTPAFFRHKKLAKTFRNKRGEGYFVTRGPDHWRGPSKVND